MIQDSNSDPAGTGRSEPSWQESQAGSHGAAGLGEAAERQAADAIGSLKQGARSLGDQAAERASRYVEDGKQAVTGHLDTFAQAVRAASDELNEKDQTMAAQLVRQAAGGLESLSRSIGGASIHDMLDSVRSFGRSNPVAFVGVSVLAGLALGRFLRASSGSSAAWNSGSDWQRGGDWAQSGEADWRGSAPDAGRLGAEYRRERSGFNDGFQPYSGPNYPAGERASFAPAVHGGADLPPRGQGYAGGGMGTDPVQSAAEAGPSSELDTSVSANSSGASAVQAGAISTGER